MYYAFIENYNHAYTGMSASTNYTTVKCVFCEDTEKQIKLLYKSTMCLR